MFWVSYKNESINLHSEDIVIAKFQKPSKIDSAAKAFRNKDEKETENFNKIKLESKDLIKIIKK